MASFNYRAYASGYKHKGLGMNFSYTHPDEVVGQDEVELSPDQTNVPEGGVRLIDGTIVKKVEGGVELPKVKPIGLNPNVTVQSSTIFNEGVTTETKEATEAGTGKVLAKVVRTLDNETGKVLSKEVEGDASLLGEPAFNMPMILGIGAAAIGVYLLLRG